MAALAVVYLTPTVVLFLFFRKYVIKSFNIAGVTRLSCCALLAADARATGSGPAATRRLARESTRAANPGRLANSWTPRSVDSRDCGA